MDRTRAFAVDTAAYAQLEVDDAGEFTWDEATIVQIDHPPHEDAFNIDRFYKIPMTAARSVEQTYRTVDGDVTMVKPPEELREAAWSLDNAPITLGHPPSRIVDGVDKIHGFTRHPEWDEEDDALRAHAYVPVNDTEAKAFIEGGGDDVSIGFWYNAETDDVPSDIDGYQRDLLVDHLAFVEEGRCSREDGCGLAADSVDVIRGFHTDVGDGDCSDGPCSCGLHVDNDPEYPQHHYESENEAREAAERMGCDGAHRHEEHGTWMPCDSHEAFEETAAEMEMDNGGYSNGNVDPTNGVLRVSDQTIDDDTLTVDYVEWHEFPFTIEVHGWDNDETENYYGWQECPPGAHEDVTVPLTNQLPVGTHTLNLNIHEQSEIENAGASVGSHDPDENPTADVIDVRVTDGHVAADSGVSYSEGDWVQWNHGDGTAVGRVDTVETAGELSVQGGTRNGTEDNPAYRLEHWDDGEFGNMVVKRDSELESASEPADYGTDAFSTDEGDIDLTPPEAAQNAAQQALDARADDDTTVNGMTDTGWSRAEQLSNGAELDPSDIVGGTDGMANWWSRHAPEIVEGGDRLSLIGTDEDNPWSVNGYTSGKGWGGIAGYRWAIRKGNEIKRAREEDADYSLIGMELDGPSQWGPDRVERDFGYVTLEHQTSDGDTITVDEAYAIADYWVCIYREGDEYNSQTASLSPSLGNEGPYGGGETVEDVTVTLDEPLSENEELYASLHFDDGGEKGPHIESEKGFIFDSAAIIIDGDESDLEMMADSMFTEIEIDESKTVAGVTFSGTSDGKLDEAAIPSDDFESHYLYPEDTKSESSYPVVDADGNLRRGNVEAAWSLGARGGIDAETHERNLRRLNDEFDNPPIDDEAFKEDMTDNPDNDGGNGPISVADLTVDAIAEKNDDVAELNEQVNELEAQLDAATDEVDNLKEELASYREDEKGEVVDEITALTDTWDEEELMELGLDALEDRLELAKDIAADVSGGVETDGSNDSVRGEEFGADGREPTSSYTGGEVYDLSDTA